jgi:hypothetical protein
MVLYNVPTLFPVPTLSNRGIEKNKNIFVYSNWENGGTRVHREHFWFFLAYAVDIAMESRVPTCWAKRSRVPTCWVGGKK